MAEKKKFLQVQIPMINKEIELLGTSNENLDNRFVKLDMTPELRGKSIELKLHIKLNEGKPIGKPVEAYLMGSYIRRMMRKGTDYVEDSFQVQCQDHRLRIKPFLITRKRVSRSVRAALRDETKKELIEYTKNKTFENILLDFINNKIQKELNIKLKKIYPLGLCEVRYIGIEDIKSYEELKAQRESKEADLKEDAEEIIKEKPEKKPKKQKKEKEEEE